MAGETRRRRLRALLKRVGANAVDPNALEQAFVHESAVREGLAVVSNERLEFVGDAIVGFLTARWLFSAYPDAPEGELALRKSSLVSDAALAAEAERLGFDALLVLGAGLAKAPASRRRSALSDAFEAFVAALAQCAGLDIAERFLIQEHLSIAGAAPPVLDAKTTLQEWTQKHSGMTPFYIESAEGPPHERIFHSRVVVSGESIAEGSGPSKKAAQQAAAAAALILLNVLPPSPEPEARKQKNA